jgi:hypothetical protein
MDYFPQFDWTKIYNNIKKAIPVDMPEPLGKDVDVHMMYDSDHAGGNRTRCSSTGFLIFYNVALSDWVSKNHATMRPQYLVLNLLP